MSKATAILLASLLTSSVGGLAPIAGAMAMNGRSQSPQVDRCQPNGGSASDPEQQATASTRPGNDFYTFVNQGWLTSQTIPPDRSELGNFNILSMQAEQDVASIIERAASGTDGSSDSKRIGDLFNSYMDRDRVERLGFRAIENDLRRIMRSRTREDLARIMADPASSSIAPMYVFADAADPRRNILHIDQNHQPQPILGLRDRDAYLGTEAAQESRRASYRRYVELALRSAGIDEPERRATDVLSLETRLAGLQWTPAQLRDRRANYNRMSLPALLAYAPGFPWEAYLQAAGVGRVDELVLGTDSAIRGQAALFAATPADAWKSYLAFHWIDNHSHLLPAHLGDARFQVFGPTSGAREQRPLRQRGISFVNRHVGHLVGRRYAELRFSPAQRQEVQLIVSDLVQAFQASIREATWMDDETRSEALRKLRNYRFKIGYPEQWRTYAGVAIDPADLVGNYQRLLRADWDLQRSRIGQRVTLDWFQTPQTVNASFNPIWNAMELPAAMLQPPFFDPCADPAVNYGAIGSIIAHEVAHAFDDQGSRFDHRGVLRDWWTDETRRRFEVAASALKAQYGSYEPLPGLRLNAEQTVGENLADLIGVSVAYRAHRLRLERSGGASQNDLTADRQFFTGWARSWRVLHTDQALRTIVANGYHPPGKFRVNGVVRNLDPWYRAFSVDRGSAMYLAPEDRVRLW